MKQQKIFDLREGIRRKEAGQAKAALPRADLLELARMGAFSAAIRRADRLASADDAMRYLVELGHEPKDLGNAAGSIFKNGEWEPTERFKPSVRTTNNGRMIRVWRLK